MKTEKENEIYHIICSISKVCRNYFFGRKYLPRDFWKPEDDINKIIKLIDKLKNINEK